MAKNMKETGFAWGERKEKEMESRRERESWKGKGVSRCEKPWRRGNCVLKKSRADWLGSRLGLKSATVR